MASRTEITVFCFAIVAAFLLFRARLEARPIVLFRRLFFISLATFAAEDIGLHLYQFQHYSENGWLLLDRVPLLVVLIAPLLVQSSRDMATCLWSGRDRPTAIRVALTASALIFAEATLIESVAVKSGLWHWTQPGVFEIPLIRILGIAAFTGIVVYLLERAKWRHRPWEETFVLAAPIAIHLVLAVAWWGLLRWITAPIPNVVAPVFAWICSIALTALSLRQQTARRVPPALLWIRAPSALFMALLLALHARQSASLVAYALAFVPPYLSILCHKKVNYT